MPRTGVARQLTPFCGRSRERERAAIWDATIEVRLIESHETKAVRPISLPLFDPLDAPSNPLVKEATKRRGLFRSYLRGIIDTLLFVHALTLDLHP